MLLVARACSHRIDLHVARHVEEFHTMCYVI